MTSLDRSSGGILFLAAFEPELAPLRQRLGALGGARFAAVGIGLAEAGGGAARALASFPSSRVVLVGTAGAYPGAGISLGAVVTVRESCLGDGAVARGEGAFVARMTERLAADGALLAAVTAVGAPAVVAATTLALTTDDDAALALGKSTGATVEHLETHAVALAARAAGVPWAAVLGITNDVGSKGREQWQAHHVATSDAVARVVLAAFGAP